MPADTDALFPTRVGMVRNVATFKTVGSALPHARGDGPIDGLGRHADRSFSPRPWGWSGGNVCASPVCRLFPTPVGMVRSAVDRRGVATPFPHARGDGPATPERRRGKTTTSGSRHAVRLLPSTAGSRPVCRRRWLSRRRGCSRRAGRSSECSAHTPPGWRPVSRP